MSAWAKAFCVAAGLVVVHGCGGYQANMSVPDHIRRIGIPNFVNATNQPNLDQELTREVREIFIVDGRLIVTDVDKADALIEGTVQQYEKIATVRDENQVPIQYKLILAVDLDFTDKATGKRLWTTRRIVHLTPTVTASETQDYDSTNFRTLTRSRKFYVLNNIGMPPEDEETVRRVLLEEMADRVYRRVLDGF